MTIWKRNAAVLIAGVIHMLAHTVALGQDVTLGYHEPVLLSDHEQAGFNRIFETTTDQRKAMDDLVAAATARLREQEKKVGEASTKAVKEFRALPEDQRRTAEARKALSDKLAAIGDADESGLRRDLFNDLRALLSEGQQQSWKKFEYFLRREKSRTNDSGWGRDHTNVLALVDAIGLTKEEKAPLAELLDSYEHDLDRALIELDAAVADLNKAMAKAREDCGGERQLLA